LLTGATVLPAHRRLRAVGWANAPPTETASSRTAASCFMVFIVSWVRGSDNPKRRRTAAPYTHFAAAAGILPAVGPGVRPAKKCNPAWEVEINTRPAKTGLRTGRQAAHLRQAGRPPPQKCRTVPAVAIETHRCAGVPQGSQPAVSRFPIADVRMPGAPVWRAPAGWNPRDSRLGTLWYNAPSIIG